MSKTGKSFDISDFPKFARPNIATIDTLATSRELSARLGDAGFMSYGALWRRVGLAVQGFASDSFIKGEFGFYSDGWKNENLCEVFTLVRDFFGGRGKWYPLLSKPLYVLGFWFKPSIKGIWFVDGKAHAVAINPRKHQPLSTDDVRFIARGIHELHCVDDPNDPVPLILDVSAPGGQTRVLRAYPMQPTEAISLEAFEHSLREFLIALNSIGLSLPPPPAEAAIVDLFKRRRPNPRL